MDRKNFVIAAAIGVAVAMHADGAPSSAPAASNERAATVDSPLVQAAKRSTSARRSAGRKVINEATLATSTRALTTSSAGASLDSTSTDSNAAAPPRPPASAKSEAASKPGAPALEGHALYASLPGSCLPPVSQNTSAPIATHAPAPVSSVQSTGAPQVAPTAAAPAAAQNTSSPQPSQNAGAYRDSARNGRP